MLKRLTNTNLFTIVVFVRLRGTQLHRKKQMRHIFTFARMIIEEIMLVITKVLDLLASPYWRVYNKLANRRYRRNNPERFDRITGEPLVFDPRTETYVRFDSNL